MNLTEFDKVFSNLSIHIPVLYNLTSAYSGWAVLRFLAMAKHPSSASLSMARNTILVRRIYRCLPPLVVSSCRGSRLPEEHWPFNLRGRRSAIAITSQTSKADVDISFG